jgi:hypothetical protein
MRIGYRIMKNCFGIALDSLKEYTPNLKKASKKTKTGFLANVPTLCSDTEASVMTNFHQNSPLIKAIRRLRDGRSGLHLVTVFALCAVMLGPIQSNAQVERDIGSMNMVGLTAPSSSHGDRGRRFEVTDIPEATEAPVEQGALVAPDGNVYNLKDELNKLWNAVNFWDDGEESRDWNGYLHEKGPSRVLVEREVAKEIEPLPDEIWDMIMGSKKKAIIEEPVVRPKSVNQIDLNATEIQKVQLESNREVIETKRGPEKMRIHRDSTEDEALELQDESESYEQLMELFNKPVFATPTPGLEREGMISFQLPDEYRNETVRDGSRARFEIRRN